MKPNLRLRGWIRVSPRHNEIMQRTALTEAGCGAFYMDGPDSVREFISELRRGEAVVVTTLARLTPLRNELKPLLAAIHKRGAFVFETTTGRRSDSADVGDMALDAVAEQTGDARAPTHDEAVKRGRKGGKTKGKNARKSRTSLVEAKSVWYDPNAGSVAERLARPEMAGWSWTTAFRKLGKTR